MILFNYENIKIFVNSKIIKTVNVLMILEFSKRAKFRFENSVILTVIYTSNCLLLRQGKVKGNILDFFQQFAFGSTGRIFGTQNTQFIHFDKNC